MNAEPKQAYEDWIATRPERVQVVLRKIDGWTAYRMKHADGSYGGALYILASVSEPVDDADALCTVQVDRFDAATGLPMWRVFGINPDDLESVGPATIDNNGCLRVES